MGSCVSRDVFTFRGILIFAVVKQVGDEHEYNMKILTTPPGFFGTS